MSQAYRSAASRPTRLVYGGPLRLDASDRLGEPARLPVPRPRIGAAAGEQLGMRPLFDDPAPFEQDQPVHPRNGREPVGDGDDGPALHQSFELLLDRRLDLA